MSSFVILMNPYIRHSIHLTVHFVVFMLQLATSFPSYRQYTQCRLHMMMSLTPLLHLRSVISFAPLFLESHNIKNKIRK